MKNRAWPSTLVRFVPPDFSHLPLALARPVFVPIRSSFISPRHALHHSLARGTEEEQGGIEEE